MVQVCRLSDKWLSRYGLMKNLHTIGNRRGTGTGTWTWTTKVTTIALLHFVQSS